MNPVLEANVDGSWARPASPTLTIKIEPRPAPLHEAQAAARLWNAMRRENPRLFDGHILSVCEIVPSSGAIRSVVVRPGSYAALAVQNPQIAGHVETGTDQLSVTAVVLARDESGRERVLLGRRGAGTRIYPSMWELGPSGGIDPPPPGAREVTREVIESQVHAEIREEIDGAFRVRIESVPAMTYDPVARSYDLVAICRADSDARRLGASNWEYEDAAWVPVADVQRFDRENAGSIIAPTRALFRALGWA